MPKGKGKREVCTYCEQMRVCEFNVFMGKADYPCCRLCIVEAKKDGFKWAARK